MSKRITKGSNEPPIESGSTGVSRSKRGRGRSTKSDTRFKSSSRGDYQNATQGPEPTTVPETRAGNPLEYYTAYPELAAAASMLPFVTKPGMPLSSLKYEYPVSDDSPFTYPWLMPGVMSLDFIPSIGYSDSVTSPASTVATQLWSKVRRAFSGSTIKVDAPDIFMYAMALDSLHMYISHLKRLYGLLSKADWSNRLFPRRILEAFGLNNEEAMVLRRNQTRLWGQICTLVKMANKFYLPLFDMHIFERHRWMCERVYKDEDVSNAQAYLFVPVACYKIGGTDTGTKLDLVDIPTAIVTGDELFDFGMELFNALSLWNDAYDINGYLMKAFDASVLFQSELIPIDYEPEFVYDATVLSQIENARTVGGQNTATFPDVSVTQDPAMDQGVYSYPRIPAAYRNFSTICNLHSEFPTGGDIIEATRLMFATVADLETETLKLECGSEIITNLHLYGCGPNDTSFQSYNSVRIVRGTDSQFTGAIHCASVLGAFAHHPPVFIVDLHDTGTGRSANTVMPFWNLCNVSEIKDEDLANLNRVCMYSLFNTFG